ncbi:MAG: GNAT family N-acetyltransferase, partial [Bacteroidia bacterium]
FTAFKNKMSSPLFTTSRLAFYPISEDDAAIMFDLNSDPEVIRYTGDSAFESVEAARLFFRERVASYARAGYGRWKVVLRDSGEFSGWCGLKYHDDENITDVGYRFFQRYWGKGYGTEACKATLHYGFQELKLVEVYAHARVENIASCRILEKCGMVFQEISQACDGDTRVYKISAQEFLS